MIERDILLVGGGLANGLIAHRFRALRPELRVTVVDPLPLGRDRTWSFHETDLSVEQRTWIAPFVAHRWPAQQVRFPGLRRRLSSSYATVSGERFRAVLEQSLGSGLIPAEARRVTAHMVETNDGRQFHAPLVIDGRGFRTSASMTCGWQKFLGLELELGAPGGLECPILMDATVPQNDGFRFIYSLPFDPQRLLVEDTCYSTSPHIEEETARREILAYAKASGWWVERVLRSESGALPIPLSGDIDQFWTAEKDSPARSGMAAGLFHMVTGYSLPEAVRLADALLRVTPLTTETVAPFIEERSRRHWRRQAFYRMLNRMLFRAALPESRWRIMERFYRLPEDLIERFYAGSTTAADKLRILIGRPPVPLAKALVCIPERSGRTSRSSATPETAWRDE